MRRCVWSRNLVAPEKNKTKSKDSDWMVHSFLRYLTAVSDFQDLHIIFNSAVLSIIKLQTSKNNSYINVQFLIKNSTSSQGTRRSSDGFLTHTHTHTHARTRNILASRHSLPTALTAAWTNTIPTMKMEFLIKLIRQFWICSLLSSFHMEQQVYNNVRECPHK